MAKNIMEMCVCVCVFVYMYIYIHVFMSHIFSVNIGIFSVFFD